MSVDKTVPEWWCTLSNANCQSVKILHLMLFLYTVFHFQLIFNWDENDEHQRDQGWLAHIIWVSHNNLVLLITHKVFIRNRSYFSSLSLLCIFHTKSWHRWGSSVWYSTFRLPSLSSRPWSVACISLSHQGTWLSSTWQRGKLLIRLKPSNIQ